MADPTILQRLAFLEEKATAPSVNVQENAAISKTLNNHATRLAAIEAALGITPPAGSV